MVNFTKFFLGYFVVFSFLCATLYMDSFFITLISCSIISAILAAICKPFADKIDEKENNKKEDKNKHYSSNFTASEKQEYYNKERTRRNSR